MSGASFVRLILLTTVIVGCSEENDNLLPRCERVRSMKVTDSRGTVLWSIRALDLHEICGIEYGKTPTRFVQITPPRGRARPFVLKERLNVERVTADGWVRTDCSASTTRTLVCAAYIGGPNPPK
jgi:hypothetical protein